MLAASFRGDIIEVCQSHAALSRPRLPPRGIDIDHALPLLALAAFASAASVRICDPLFPLLSREFSASLAEVTATATGFAVAYGCCLLYFGPLGDRVGKLSVISGTAAIAAVLTLACAAAPSLGLLTLTRIAAGCFAGAAVPLSLAWLADQVAVEERQPALARLMIGQMMGLSMGQAASAAIADAFGWRAAFILLAVVFLAAALALRTAARRDGWRHRRLQMQRRSRERASLARQARQLLARPWSRLILLAAGVHGLVIFSAMGLVATAAQTDRGLTPTLAGLSVALFGVGGLCYAGGVRRLLDHMGAQSLIAVGGLMFALAMALLAIPSAPPLQFIAPILAGLGYYMVQNTLQHQASQLSRSSTGTTFALFAASMWLGQAVGVTAGAGFAGRAGFERLFAVAGMAELALGLTLALALRARARKLNGLGQDGHDGRRPDGPQQDRRARDSREADGREADSREAGKRVTTALALRSVPTIRTRTSAGSCTATHPSSALPASQMLQPLQTVPPRRADRDPTRQRRSTIPIWGR